MEVSPEFRFGALKLRRGFGVADHRVLAAAEQEMHELSDPDQPDVRGAEAMVACFGVELSWSYHDSLGVIYVKYEEYQ